MNLSTFIRDVLIFIFESETFFSALVIGITIVITITSFKSFVRYLKRKYIDGGRYED